MSDLAQAALDRVRQDLMIDDEWSIREMRDLTWTPYRLKQHFSVLGPYESRGMAVYRISSRVSVARGSGRRDLAAALNLVNLLTVGDALLYDPEQDAVVSELAMVLHEGVFDWKITYFAQLALMQVSRLEAMHDHLEQLLGAELIRWRHPLNGFRQDPDDILGVLHSLVLPSGAEPSRFASETEFDALDRWIEGTPFYSAGGSPAGQAIEVSFGQDDTALVRLWTDQAHPDLGSGLLVTIEARMPDVGPDGLHDLAAQVNRDEVVALSNELVGAWHVGHETLAHAHFVPNVFFRPGLTVHSATAACVRVIWLDEHLNGRVDRAQRPSAGDTSFRRLMRVLRSPFST